MKGIFIAGTDTGVGKTIITGLLGRYLLENRYNVITQKWIQTGCREFSSDINTHLELMGKNRREIKDYAADCCPYLFSRAVSPHLASSLSDKKINPSKIRKSFEFLATRFNFVLAEGIGGVLVPYSPNGLVIDIVAELELPVLIVAMNKLGAINHTLLTIEALKKRGLRILGIIFNQPKKELEIVLKDNPLIIKRLSGEKIFGSLPWQRDFAKLYNNFIPIGEKICSDIRM